MSINKYVISKEVTFPKENTKYVAQVYCDNGVGGWIMMPTSRATEFRAQDLDSLAGLVSAGGFSLAPEDIISTEPITQIGPAAQDGYRIGIEGVSLNDLNDFKRYLLKIGVEKIAAELREKR